MTRQDYIYQLAGKITDKRTKKKKDGTNFYQLSVIIEDKEGISKINVFSDSCREDIWQTIEENKYLQKEYLLHCKNFMGAYYLVDWEILKENGKEK